MLLKDYADGKLSPPEFKSFSHILDLLPDATSNHHKRDSADKRVEKDALRRFATTRLGSKGSNVDEVRDGFWSDPVMD